MKTARLITSVVATVLLWSTPAIGGAQESVLLVPTVAVQQVAVQSTAAEQPAVPNGQATEQAKPARDAAPSDVSSATAQNGQSTSRIATEINSSKTTSNAASKSTPPKDQATSQNLGKDLNKQSKDNAAPPITFSFGTEKGGASSNQNATQVSEAVKIIVLLTVLSLGPAIVVSMTAFIRIIIVLSMLRHALGMPETPPNAVLVSLALFLTTFVMVPVVSQVNRDAWQPFVKNELNTGEAVERASVPLRDFMLRQVRDADLRLMYELSNEPLPTSAEEVSLVQLTPAFILNELRVSFQIGFVIFLPFLLIDLVVSSVLLALGMMMVPPASIALPLKILLFVLIDGWALVLRGVLGSFQVT